MKTTKILLITGLTLLTLISAFSLQPLTLHAQGTAFTYQGRLNDGGSPANGSYDLQFALFDAATGGHQVGGAVTNLAVGVTNGLFTTTTDFGPGIFTGSALWLQIGVETNGGGGNFTLLNKLQPITPTPYAIYSSSASSAGAANYAATAVSATVATTANGVSAGSVTGTGIASGQVVKSLNGLADGVTLSPGANVTITPSGNTLMIASTAGGGGGGSNSWSLTGNSGTSPANGNFLGTLDNQPLELHVNGVRVLRLEPGSSGQPNVIGGAANNAVAGGGFGATIGGANNTAGDAVSTVGGGWNNVATGAASTVGGGWNNNAVGGYSTVGGGHGNIASGPGSFVGGGGWNVAYFEGNTAAGEASTVCGGLANNATNIYATVGGGADNTAGGVSSMVGGGNNNIASGPGSFVGGGGYDGFTYAGNTASGDASTVGGGIDNQAMNYYATVGGGEVNTADGIDSTVGGGVNNQATNLSATVGGGEDNTAGGGESTVGGGGGNQAMNDYATVGGGVENTASGGASTVGGGYDNNANNQSATIGGGTDNTAGGGFSTVPGGYWNVAAGTYSFAAGQQAHANNQGAFVWADSQNGTYSSWANDQFCIRAQGGVQLDPTTSLSFGTATRQMLNLYGSTYGIGVQAGTLFFRSDATYASSGDFSWFRGGTFNNGQNQPGSGGAEMMRLDHLGNLNVSNNVVAHSLILASDRNLKSNFMPVNTQEVLAKVAALPITAWDFKSEAGVQHIGPMAQDFYAAFNVGSDDKHIAVVDESGVALAAIQGLNQKLEDGSQNSEARIQKLEAENAELKARLEKLEQLITAKNGGGQ
jgi:hypothetical protein